MDMRKTVITLMILITVSTLLSAGIDPLINLNPQIPFSFTYEYRTPREWQVEVLTGTSLDIASLSGSGTGTVFNAGHFGLKMGVPGDIVLVATWPWIGGYLSTDEGQFLPEFDFSLNVPLTLEGNVGSSAPAINVNAVLKKSLPPLRFSVGGNMLFSNRYEMDPGASTDTTVGENYLGTGIEWQMNPYFKISGEYRYQFSQILYEEEEGFNFEMLLPSLRAGNIVSIAGEYTLNTEKFIMKVVGGYSINLIPDISIPDSGIPFNTHSVSAGVSFLFPFPIDSEDWETPYSPVGEVP